MLLVVEKMGRVELHFLYPASVMAITESFRYLKSVIQKDADLDLLMKTVS